MEIEKERAGQPTGRDRAATIATVAGALFLVGHVAALCPPGPAADWASAAVFTGLIFGYASLAASGRRTDLSIFLAAGGIALLLFLLWFVMMLSLDDGSWYYSTFNTFVVGLSGRGWGAHGGLAWLVIWPISILLMVVVAVTLRNLAGRAAGRI